MNAENGLHIGRGVIDGSLTPKEIIFTEKRGYRMEMVPVELIISEATLVDDEHATELRDSMEGEWGQISPLTLRARVDRETGEVVCDIIDGFHRTAGLKYIARMRKEAVHAKAVVLYGCTDDEMYDLRVLAASSVKSVKFARTVEWMKKSFESMSWQCERIDTLIREDRITLSQIFSLAFQDTSGERIGLKDEEARELKKWAQEKANRWGKPLSTLMIEMKTAELASPHLVKKVRLSGGGGTGYLTQARLHEIVIQIPNEHALQERVAEVVVKKNVTAKDAGVLTAAIATAYAAGDEERVEKLLESPFLLFSEGDNDDSKLKKGPNKNGNSVDHHGLEVGFRDRRAQEQIRMQGDLIKQQDAIIAKLQRELRERRSDGDVEVDCYILAKRPNTSIIFDVAVSQIRSTGDNYQVDLTPIETRMLQVLMTYEVPVEMFALYRLIFDREPAEDEVIAELLRPHISNLRSKIGQISPLLRDNVENVRGVGYRWRRET